jgi:hypothetical protein
MTPAMRIGSALVLLAAGLGRPAEPSIGETTIDPLPPEYDRPVPPGHVRRVLPVGPLVQGSEARIVPRLTGNLILMAGVGSWEAGGGHGRFWYDPDRTQFVVVQRPAVLDEMARILRAWIRFVVNTGTDPEELF